MSSEYFEFMIREWHSDDAPESIFKEVQSDSESVDSINSIDSDEDKKYEPKKYNIYLFGNTSDGHSVCLHISGFTPYFFVKIPEDWHESYVNDFVKVFKSDKYLKWNGRNLISHKIMEKIDAYGFTNMKKQKFLRLVFSSESAYRSAKYLLRDPIKNFGKMKLYDANMDPMLTFMHLRDIQASGWVKIKNSNLKKIKVSRTKYNYSTFWKNVDFSDKKSIPPMLSMSFDIECYSFNGMFPEPSNAKNTITMIGSAFQRFGSAEVQKTVVVLGECDDIPGVEVFKAKTEKELLKKWVKIVMDRDPDQIIGYNIDDFDWTYIYERSVLCEVEDYVLNNIGRLFHVTSTFKKDKFESSAHGVNNFNYISTPGIGQIDLLHWFRKEDKSLDSYKLEAVSSKYLKEHKRDVDVQQIFKWSGPEGDSKSRAIVADYCAQDTLLPLRLMLNRVIIPNMIEMSRVTYVPFTWLILRGEQIKAFSQLRKELSKLGFVMPSEIIPPDSEYKGATVLNCERGSYFQPVSGLDFASLYPSIMVAHNLCPTTIVIDQKYNNLPGIEYKRFTWTEETSADSDSDEEDSEKPSQTNKEVKLITNDYTFVQNVPGVIPGILMRLWKERKAVRAIQAKTEDPELKAILNGEQLAIKRSMNSIYGFFGVSKGICPCQPIAACVTYTGRCMIAHSKECAEKWYDGSEASNGIIAKVRYGDSISAESPVTYKLSDSGVQVSTVEDLFNQGLVSEYNNFKPGEPDRLNKFQSMPLQNVYVQTSQGWRKVKRLIKHKVQKKLFRITTEKGSIIVTEDHSLIRSNGKFAKPYNVTIGDNLLHCLSFDK